MFNYILTCLMTIIAMVFADLIYIYGPPSNGVYHPKDIMYIRYHVRSIGMTKIWQTSATLIHESTNKTIDSFPTVSWNASSGNNTAHTTWSVPSGLPNGNYTLSIGGNVTRLCSKNSDGKAPFTHCQSTMFEFRSFSISNGTQSTYINI